VVRHLISTDLEEHGTLWLYADKEAFARNHKGNQPEKFGIVSQCVHPTAEGQQKFPGFPVWEAGPRGPSVFTCRVVHKIQHEYTVPLDNGSILLIDSQVLSQHKRATEVQLEHMSSKRHRTQLQIEAQIEAERVELQNAVGTQAGSSGDGVGGASVQSMPRAPAFDPRMAALGGVMSPAVNRGGQARMSSPNGAPPPEQNNELEADVNQYKAKVISYAAELNRKDMNLSDPRTIAGHEKSLTSKRNECKRVNAGELMRSCEEHHLHLQQVRQTNVEHSKFKPFAPKPLEKFESKWVQSLGKLLDVPYLAEVLSAELKQVHRGSRLNIACKQKDFDRACDLADWDEICVIFISLQAGYDFYIVVTERVLVEMLDNLCATDDIDRAESKILPFINVLYRKSSPPAITSANTWTEVVEFFQGMPQGAGRTLAPICHSIATKKEHDIWKVILSHQNCQPFIARALSNHDSNQTANTRQDKITSIRDESKDTLRTIGDFPADAEGFKVKLVEERLRLRSLVLLDPSPFGPLTSAESDLFVEAGTHLKDGLALIFKRTINFAQVELNKVSDHLLADFKAAIRLSIFNPEQVPMNLLELCVQMPVDNCIADFMKVSLENESYQSGLGSAPRLQNVCALMGSACNFLKHMNRFLSNIPSATDVTLNTSGAAVVAVLPQVSPAQIQEFAASWSAIKLAGGSVEDALRFWKTVGNSFFKFMVAFEEGCVRPLAAHKQHSIEESDKSLIFDLGPFKNSTSDANPFPRTAAGLVASSKFVRDTTFEVKAISLLKLEVPMNMQDYKWIVNTSKLSDMIANVCEHKQWFSTLTTGNTFANASARLKEFASKSEKILETLEGMNELVVAHQGLTGTLPTRIIKYAKAIAMIHLDINRCALKSLKTVLKKTADTVPNNWEATVANKNVTTHTDSRREGLQFRQNGLSQELTTFGQNGSNQILYNNLARSCDLFTSIQKLAEFGPSSILCCRP
jgi:hypothetical protein